MKRKILIIDDDPGIQDIFRIIFERVGYEVAVEPNGRSIINNKYDIPDVFILDRQLSGIDGLEICAYLKSNSRSKDIPVIMVSASPDTASMAKAAGADAFIEKPFNISELLAIVENQLEGHKILKVTG